jgi:ribulose-5-phosphate 4-epimerase/fuculose-1-phosphate aldolase
MQASDVMSSPPPGLALLTTQSSLRAQAPPISAGPVDAAAIEDLVAGSRILADQGVLDASGHVSMRHPQNPNRYLMSRAQAPALVTAEDIMEFDLDSNPVDRRDREIFAERFIHGEIYKVRPDVRAVIHTHSPAVIPFGVTQVPLKPVHQSGGFLVAGVPIFEIRSAVPGQTGMLVRNAALGNALAEALADKAVVLMRGHGNAVVGPDLRTAVRRAVSTEVNARLLTIALQIGGPINYLSAEEAAAMEALAAATYSRAWELWKKKAMRSE